MQEAMQVEVLSMGCMTPGPEPVLFEQELPGGRSIRSWSYRIPGRPGRELIPAARLRRLGRTQRIALAAAHLALDVRMPDDRERVAVTLGTGLGELFDTAAFLENLVENREQHPRPARFINSVPSALASEIAISFGLGAENMSFTHGGTSFELALSHARRVLQAGRAKWVLACAADGLSPYVVALGEELGWWAEHGEPLRPLAGASDPGTLPGEGAAAFLLARPRSRPGGREHARAVIEAVAIERLPRGRTGEPELLPAGPAFLRRVVRDAGTSLEEVDLLLLGANGSPRSDQEHWQVIEALGLEAGRDPALACYKQRCGEFHTASALALAWAVEMLLNGATGPGLVAPVGPPLPEDPARILIYSLSRRGLQSLVLVARCSV